MPDGRTHDEITLVTATLIAPVCFDSVFAGSVGRAALFLGSHLMSGLLFSDDLDTHSIEYRRWRMLRFLWLPYQKLIPHRSWLSHGLIIGPALRIAYFAGMLSLFFWLVLALLSRVVPLDAGGILLGVLSGIVRFVADHPDWVIIAFLGFVLGGSVHSVSDALWSWWRRAIRPPVVQVLPPSVPTPTHHGFPAPDFVRADVRSTKGTKVQDTD